MFHKTYVKLMYTKRTGNFLSTVYLVKKYFEIILVFNISLPLYLRIFGPVSFIFRYQVLIWGPVDILRLRNDFRGQIKLRKTEFFRLLGSYARQSGLIPTFWDYQSNI
jgi:hypothetical protein